MLDLTALHTGSIIYQVNSEIYNKYTEELDLDKLKDENFELVSKFYCVVTEVYYRRYKRNGYDISITIEPVYDYTDLTSLDLYELASYFEGDSDVIYTLNRNFLFHYKDQAYGFILKELEKLMGDISEIRDSVSSKSYSSKWTKTYKLSSFEIVNALKQGKCIAFDGEPDYYVAMDSFGNFYINDYIAGTIEDWSPNLDHLTSGGWRIFGDSFLI